MEKAVFLDASTVGDASLDPLKELPVTWHFYPHSAPHQLKERLENVSIVVTNKVPLTKEVLEAAPSLKLVCVAATGYNIIDLDTCKRLNIHVCNVPDYSSTSVVQHTFLLILSLFGSFPAYLKAHQEGKWQKSPIFSLMDYTFIELHKKVLGIVGFGRIGQKLAAIAGSFGMEVLIAEHPVRPAPGSLPLKDLLPKVDVLSLHLPLNARTHHLISAPELSLLKPSAFLVNVARGGLINERDLARALKEGTLAGAALDVLSEEPPSAAHPLLQKDIPHLILTPHIAWASKEARLRLVDTLKSNIQSFFDNSLINLIF